MDTLALTIERQRMIRVATNAARAASLGAFDADAAEQLATAERMIKAARKAGCTSEELTVARRMVANLRASERTRAEWIESTAERLCAVAK